MLYLFIIISVITGSLITYFTMLKFMNKEIDDIIDGSRELLDVTDALNNLQNSMVRQQLELAQWVALLRAFLDVCKTEPKGYTLAEMLVPKEMQNDELYEYRLKYEKYLQKACNAPVFEFIKIMDELKRVYNEDREVIQKQI